jgi:hypothetical protein
VIKTQSAWCEAAGLRHGERGNNNCAPAAFSHQPHAVSETQDLTKNSRSNLAKFESAPNRPFRGNEPHPQDC